MKKHNLLIQENTKKSRLYALLTGYDYTHIYSMGIITAENPMAKKSSSIENKVKMLELKKYLKDSNFVYLQVKGKYHSEENSLIVQNVTQSFVRELAKKYQQEAFIYGEVYTNKEEQGMRFEYWAQGTKEVVANDKDYGKILKVVPNGKFELFSTRETFLKFENPTDYYTRFRDVKFQIPFFDSKYDDVIIEKEYGFSLRANRMKEVNIKELKNRIKYLVEGKNKTEKWKWENRGIIKLMALGEITGEHYKLTGFFGKRGEYAQANQKLEEEE